VAALVQPRQGRSIDLAALDSHLRTQIAGYKVPRTVWLVDAVARTPSGKPDYAWAQRYAAHRAPAAGRQEAQSSGAGHPAA
jgi:3-oxocholest-4-en-26-oate---CoA ligase